MAQQGCATGQGMVLYLIPRPPLSAVMHEMTTQAQKGNNITLQGNTMQSCTQRRHVFGTK